MPYARIIWEVLRFEIQVLKLSDQPQQTYSNYQRYSLTTVVNADEGNGLDSPYSSIAAPPVYNQLNTRENKYYYLLTQTDSHFWLTIQAQIFKLF